MKYVSDDQVVILWSKAGVNEASLFFFLPCSLSVLNFSANKTNSVAGAHLRFLRVKSCIMSCAGFMQSLAFSKQFEIVLSYKISQLMTTFGARCGQFKVLSCNIRITAEKKSPGR